MQKILLLILFIVFGESFNQLTAQSYSWKVDGTDTIFFTPFFRLTEYKFFRSTYYINLIKNKDGYFFQCEYLAKNITYLDSNIISTTFVFTDGYELTIPSTYCYPVRQDVNSEYNIIWMHYSVKSQISIEQLVIFTNKQLFSVANNFKISDKIFDAYVPPKKALMFSKIVAFFLNKDEPNDKILFNRYANNKYCLEYNNEKWDF